MPERVVMLVSNDCVSDPRVEKEAAVLCRVGYEVVVLAWDRDGVAPEVEHRRGYRIERMGPRTAYGAGWQNLSRFRHFWADATERASALEPDVVHCHDLDTVPAGLRILRKRPGTKLVVDHHELYRRSRMVPQRGVLGLLARAMVDAIDRYALHKAALIVIAAPGFADRYERVAHDRVIVMENAPDTDMFRPSERRPDRPLTVCYIGQKRYAGSLILLMQIVQKHEDMAALLAGGGVAEQEVSRSAEGLDRIETVGRLRYEEIPAYYRRSNVVWGLYDVRVGNILTAFPVKVMEGMASGLPVLVDAGTWVGEYVTEHGIGIAVDGRDEEAVEVALVRLKDDREAADEMGRRGRRLVEEGLSWRIVSKRLVEAYSCLR